MGGRNASFKALDVHPPHFEPLGLQEIGIPSCLYDIFNASHGLMISSCSSPLTLLFVSFPLPSLPSLSLPPSLPPFLPLPPLPPPPPPPFSLPPSPLPPRLSPFLPPLPPFLLGKLCFLVLRERYHTVQAVIAVSEQVSKQMVRYAAE